SDSEAPTNPAIATRGSLIFIIMFSCILIDSGTVELNKNPLKIASVSLRGILTVPIDTPKIITLIKSVINIRQVRIDLVCKNVWIDCFCKFLCSFNKTWSRTTHYPRSHQIFVHLLLQLCHSNLYDLSLL